MGDTYKTVQSLKRIWYAMGKVISQGIAETVILLQIIVKEINDEKVNYHRL